MGILRKITPGGRKLSFFLIAISITGFFFALYFLKYLPANKEELNNRGFRILRQMSNNITDKNGEYKTRLYKNIKSLSGTDSFQAKLLQESKNFINGDRKVEALLRQNVYLGNDLVLRPIEFKDSSRRRTSDVNTRRRVSRQTRFNDTTVETNVRFLRNDTSRLQFITRVITDSLTSYIRIECDLNRFLTSIINARNDLFEHYLIMKDPHHINQGDNVFYDSNEDLVYQSGNLGLTNVSDFDSLFTKSSSNREYGVNEMKLSGTQYTMFVQPLEWNRKKLVLIGLLKKGSYNSRALSISPEVIYTAIIILVLLVCSLPFVKVLLITPGERLMVKDVVMTGVSLILGTALVVVVLTDWFLFNTLQKKNQRTLSNLSDTLYNGFEKDISNAYKQIKYYDSAAITKQEELIDRSPKADSLFVRPAFYKIFDQVFWTDSAGMQKIKWQTDSKLSPMLDYSDRNYIKKIVGDDAYDMPDSRIDGKFYIEPVYSNTTGEYKINISTKSNLPIIKKHILQALDSAAAHHQSDTMLVLKNYEYVNPDNLFLANGGTDHHQIDLLMEKDPSLQIWHRDQIESFRKNAAYFDSCKVACIGTRMFTEPIPVLPPEYGFCVIDQDGRVLVHSDIKRSLLENLIAETNNDVRLKQAIKKREDKLISNILYYGDKHELRIRPVHNLPFYMVTFYNQNFLVDANSRMVAFSLCVGVTFFIFLLLTHMILRFRDQSSFKLNFTPLKFDWFRPQKNAPRELDRMRRFITLYATGIVFLSILDSLFIAKDFWVVLFAVLFIPFYVFMGVSAIKSFHIPNKLSSAGYFLLAVLMLLINFSFLYYLQNDQLEDNGPSVYWHALFFHLVSMGCIGYLFRKFGRNAQLREVETLNDSEVSYGKGFTPDIAKYAFTAIAILVVVSVLPPVATLYYAYKEEKLQNVKTRQLDLANDIQQRARRVYARHLNGKGKYKKTVYEQTYTKAFRDSLVTKFAIFSGDVVIPDSIAKTRTVMQDDLTNQSFYENLLSFIPDVDRMQDSSYQLKNKTSDNTWYWKQTPNLLNPKVSLTFKGMGEQKRTITIDSLSSPYESGTSYGRWFAVIFVIILSGLLWGVYVLIKTAGRKVFMIGYRENLKDCLEEEAFVEKFAKHIELYKMVILDQDGSFAKQIRRPNEHCKQIVEGSSIADFHKVITGANKEKVIVLTLLKQSHATVFNGSGIGNGHASDLLEITETDFRRTLPEHWKPILIVKPRRLKNKEKYPKELLDLHNLEEWTRVAIGSMGRYFTLINKTQYTSLLHYNLEEREMKSIMLNAKHTEKFPDNNFIFNTQREFADTYEALWQDCTPEQKFVVHDFAIDGFANYRNEAVIDSLIRKGLLIYKNESLQLMSNSFRNYVLEKTGSPELTAIQSGMNKTGTWDIFKVVLFVIIVAVALFIFFTQEEVFKQISAAMASLLALVTMLFKFVEQSKQVPKAV